MNVEGLNIAHCCANILGTTPNLIKNKYPQNRQLIDVVRGILFIILVGLIIISLLYGTIVSIDRNIHKTVFITMTLMEFIVSLFNVISVYQFNLRHSDKLQMFLHRLRKLEVFIINPQNIPKANMWCLIEFYSWAAFKTVFATLNGYVYVTSVGWDVFRFFFPREIQNYHLGLVMILVTRYAQLLALRINELNQHLKNFVVNRELKEKQISINVISKAYTTIAELIDEYNCLIGPLSLCYCGCMVFNILVPINMALLFVYDIPIHENHTFGYSFVVYCILWFIFPSVSRK